MKPRRIHLRLRVPSRLRSDYRPSLQGIDTCRQLSALRAGMMITRSRWSTPVSYTHLGGGYHPRQGDCGKASY